MRKEMTGLLMLIFCGALLAGGCAKKELVKSEGEIPSATASKPAETEEAPAKPPVKEEKVQEQAVKEAPATQEEAAPARAAELATIYFDFNSFILTDPSRATLKKNGEDLMKDNSLKVQIQGNCDERGSEEYNLALGEKRAKAAMDYLVTLGVPADRLSIISYGKEKPVDPGHDEAAWAKNRRDDFAIVK
jgi:peptidoglycan-associated lipoprotein